MLDCIFCYKVAVQEIQSPLERESTEKDVTFYYSFATLKFILANIGPFADVYTFRTYDKIGIYIQILRSSAHTDEYRLVSAGDF